MKRFTVLLVLVVLISTFSLAHVPSPEQIGQEQGTRAEIPGLVVDKDISKDTEWNKDYPFIWVRANVTVLPGVTLTIVPGVTVRFDYRTSLTVKGTIIAEGNIFYNIRFVPYEEDAGTRYWKGITLQNDSVNCSLNHASIEHADRGITIYGSDPLITNCSVEYNYFYGILCGANSRPTVRDNYINFTTWAGIICDNESLPAVISNYIRTSYYGIVCYDVAEVSFNYIDSCWIGIICWGDSNVTNNQVRDCMDGIHGFFSAPRIENNYIVSCDGNGTRFTGSDAKIKNNTLRYNNVGMDISYDAKEILENMEGNFVNGIEIRTCFYVDQDDMVIDGLEVDSGWSDGFYGRLTAQGSVTLYDCSNVTFRNINITNSDHAIYATNSSFKVYNSHFNNSRKGQVYLDHNASGQAYNGSIDSEKVIVGGPSCLFITYDEIQVKVKDYYGEPVPNANVVIRESQLTLHNVTTDEGGETGSMLVKDSTISEAGLIPSPLSIYVYSDEYNFEENPMTGIYVRDTRQVTFDDLGDIFPPAVSDISVEDGHRSFPVNGTITITFDEPMNRTSAEEAFSISGNITGNFSWDGASMTFIPDTLEYQTDYLVVISKDAVDLWGNHLPEPVSFSFTTVARPGASNNALIIAVIAIFAAAALGGFFVMKKLK